MAPARRMTRSYREVYPIMFLPSPYLHLSLLACIITPTCSAAQTCLSPATSWPFPPQVRSWGCLQNSLLSASLSGQLSNWFGSFPHSASCSSGFGTGSTVPPRFCSIDWCKSTFIGCRLSYCPCWLCYCWRPVWFRRCSCLIFTILCWVPWCSSLTFQCCSTVSCR